MTASLAMSVCRWRKRGSASTEWWKGVGGEEGCGGGGGKYGLCFLVRIGDV